MQNFMRNPIPGSKTTQDVNFDDFFMKYFLKIFPKTKTARNQASRRRISMKIGPIKKEYHEESDSGIKNDPGRQFRWLFYELLLIFFVENA